MSSNNLESSDAAMAAIGDRAGDRIFKLVGEKIMPVKRRYLRPEAAAEYIGMDKTSMRNWRWKRIGPKFMKIGALVVYAVDDLDAFMRTHELHASGSLEQESADEQA
jgi:hypothetical protein